MPRRPLCFGAALAARPAAAQRSERNALLRSPPERTRPLGGSSRGRQCSAAGPVPGCECRAAGAGRVGAALGARGWSRGGSPAAEQEPAGRAQGSVNVGLLWDRDVEMAGTVRHRDRDSALPSLPGSAERATRQCRDGARPSAAPVLRDLSAVCVVPVCVLRGRRGPAHKCDAGHLSRLAELGGRRWQPRPCRVPVVTRLSPRPSVPRTPAAVRGSRGRRLGRRAAGGGAAARGRRGLVRAGRGRLSLGRRG